MWTAAQRESRFLFSKDLGFSDVRKFAPGSHHGILLLRLKEPGRDALVGRVRLLLREEKLDDWEGCLVIVTDLKVRIRSPKTT